MDSFHPPYISFSLDTHIITRGKILKMDSNNIVIDPDMSYPILFMPKKCTTLETNSDISDNVYINLSITSRDTEGNDTIIYNGYCIVKIVESSNVNPNCDRSSPDSIDIDQMPVILSGASPQYNHRVWIDPSRSPFVYNHYDPETQERYSIRDSGGMITVEQHNTYITQNVYNCKETNAHNCKEALLPANEVGCTRYRKVQESVTGELDTNPSYYGEDEFECGVFLSQLPQEIMNETQSRIRNEKKFSIQQENNAVKQLMSDVQSSSRQRKTILFLGHDSHSGQTIQNISYNDPEVKCAAVEGDTELVIDESKANPTKKFQCDKCKTVFPQISSFRKHMVGHGNRNEGPAENELNFMCMECGKNLKTQRKLEIHSLGHGDPDLECLKCAKVFSTKFSLRVHMNIHDRKYPCNYCDKTFAYFHNLKSHLLKKHSLYICDDENCAFVTQKLSDIKQHKHWSQTEDKVDSTMHCEDLGDEVEQTIKEEDQNLDQERLNPDLVQENVSESSSSDMLSPNEGSSQGSKADFTKSSEELVIEISALPSEDNSDITELDNEDFALTSEENSVNSVLEDVNDGERIRKADSVIATVMSNSIFLLSSNKARGHRYRNTCSVCEKSFDRMDDLKRHLIEHVIKSTLAKTPRTITGRLNITCEVCQTAVFSKVDKYKAHLREHAKLTIYRCTFCDKSFSDSSNFSKHKKIHSLNYLQCDLCLRKFNSKKMIAQHMDQHKRTKPVKCRHCHRWFHFESMLNKHMRTTHRKEEQYRCRVCDAMSSSMKEKWEHEWRAHSVRKMIVDCLVCGAQYRKYTELKRHCSEEHLMNIPSARKLIKRRCKLPNISYNINFEED